MTQEEKRGMIENMINAIQSLPRREGIELAEEACYAIALLTGDSCSEAQRILTKALIAVAVSHEGVAMNEAEQARAEVMN